MPLAALRKMLVMHPATLGQAIDALRKKELCTVRTESLKLTVEANSGAGELYDLVNDPDEMVNRFGDPAYATQQKMLVDMMHSRPDDVCAALPQVGMA